MPNATPVNCWTPLVQLWETLVQSITNWEGDRNVASPNLAQVVAQTTLISPQVQSKLADLKLLLSTPNLQTSHPDNLISLHVRGKKNDQKASPKGQTEFFVDLDDIDNLPEGIQEKLDPADIYDGIHFMVPNAALPKGGLQDNKALIKSWLGLTDEAVDFDLHPKPKSH